MLSKPIGLAIISALLTPLLTSASPFYRFDVVNTTRYAGTLHKSPLHRNCTLPHNRPGGNECQVVRTCREEGQVALTYDDGMFLTYEASIAHTFGSDSKATFFLNGDSTSFPAVAAVLLMVW